jgi:PAS domain S-box-containing protein
LAIKKKLAGYTIDITDRKNAETELRKSQELLKATSEMASLGGWEIDLEKQTLTWSDEVFKIHETDENFIPTVEKAIDFYAPESIPLITEAVNRAIEKGEAFDLQLQIITAKGVRKWVHAKGNAVLANGKAVKITGTFQDIHQRKLIEEQLKQKTDEIETQNEEIHQQNEEYRQLNEELFRSDERYRSLITHLEAGVVVHSADTSIINNNQRASFLLGLNEEQIKGKLAIDPRWKFININNLPLSLEEYPVNRIISSQKPFKDFILGVCRPENNDVIWLTVNGFPVFNKLQQLTEVVISFIDITDRKLNEIKLKEKSEEIETQNEEYRLINEEYKQINDELFIARYRAEESDRLKSAFLANMSHEIRTPMNGIVGFADLLNSPNITNEKRKDFTAIIIERSNHLLNIVNDILDISKIEAGMVTVKNENVPINILLLELYTYYSNHDKLREIKLEVKYGIEDTKTRIYIDDTKMMQIFNNLISNALKFTSKGHIVFGYELKGKMLQFFVEDSGIGIPDDYKEKVFDRFIQVEMEFSKNYGGTGLGLSITKELVHLMGGEIWIESKLGVGTKVFFTMPYEIAKSEEELLIENPHLLNNKNIAGKSILIVDDDETNLYYLNEVTTNLELKVFKANNGFEAIEQFKNNTDISLILMDIKMPVMGGMEATKLIKSINSNVKVIAQTAHALLTEQDIVIAGGCDDYISKPIDREKLISLIRKHI